MHDIKLQDVKQDNQALLKAKYCPRVAAASRTQKKTPQNPCDLDLWLMTLKFSGCRAIVKILQNSIKVSAAVHELSTVT